MSFWLQGPCLFTMKDLEQNYLRYGALGAIDSQEICITYTHGKMLWENRFVMDTQTLIASIDAEIARLEQAKSLLTGSSGRTTLRTGRAAKPGRAGGRAGKRVLSPEALERIREGQRKRWAKVKRSRKSA